MLNIYFDFIKQLEGFAVTGYVPDSGNSRSGVTIASGFDLGCRSKDDIYRAFPNSLADKLSAYCGYKGDDAVSILQHTPLTISSADADVINEFAYSSALNRLVDAWNASDASVGFDALAAECQTVIASVAFQYGNLSTATPNFWRQVTAQDWSGALANLRNFGDRYKTRRAKEADLLEVFIKEKGNYSRIND